MKHTLEQPRSLYAPALHWARAACTPRNTTCLLVVRQARSRVLGRLAVKVRSSESNHMRGQSPLQLVSDIPDGQLQAADALTRG
jgi:hypothetical protein